MYDGFAGCGRNPDLEDLLPAIESIKTKASSIYIVLDGLDECSETERKIILEKVIPRLSKSFRLFVTARLDPEEKSFPQAFPRSHTLQIEARSEDVEKMLTERLEVAKLNNKPLETMIKEKIIEDTGGM